MRMTVILMSIDDNKLCPKCSRRIFMFGAEQSFYRCGLKLLPVGDECDEFIPDPTLVEVNYEQIKKEYSE